MSGKDFISAGLVVNCPFPGDCVLGGSPRSFLIGVGEQIWKGSYPYLPFHPSVLLDDFSPGHVRYGLRPRSVNRMFLLVYTHLYSHGSRLSTRILSGSVSAPGSALFSPAFLLSSPGAALPLPSALCTKWNSYSNISNNGLLPVGMQTCICAVG